MSNTKIEWTEQTWNPIIGCSHISPGCDNCYAEKMAYRLAHIDSSSQYTSVVKSDQNDGGEFKPDDWYFIPEWNGKTRFVGTAINKPLERKKPTMYFVCSMGDLFHESVPFEWIDKVMAVIAISQQHTFQILTKRPDRMLEYYKSNPYERILSEAYKINHLVKDIGPGIDNPNFNNGWKNLWLGVTAENQEQANKRIPILLSIPATVRFVSVEPMLGSIDFDDLVVHGQLYRGLHGYGDINPGPQTKIDWVICGGETGSKARPMHPDWVRSLRDQCKEANVPFFFKQCGEYLPISTGDNKQILPFGDYDVKTLFGFKKAGKKKSGHLLDGVEHREFPKGGQQ